MSFSQTLKRLRKGADLTQEQLAERLYVTPQAVSRWETGTSLPELSMIGPIANLFGVSADELLGICIDRNSEAILQILEEDKNLRNAAKFEESAALLFDAHRRYPGSFEIMERLAHALINVYSRKGLKDYSEVIRLCDTVLDKCTDSAIRRRALGTLGYAYSYTG